MTKEELLQLKQKIAKMSEEEKRDRDLYLRKVALGEIVAEKTGYASIDKPWLKWFEPQVISGDIPRENIYQYLLERNAQNLDNIAIEYAFAKITYRKLFKKIEEVADTLYALGIRKGDTIMSLLPNVPEATYLIYAAAKIGAKIDLLDPFVNKELLARYCDNTKPKLLFTLDIMADNAISNLPKSTYDKVVVLSPVQSVPGLNLVVKPSKKITYNDRVITWNTFLKQKGNVKSEWCDYEPNMPFAILHTGGTTGIPKGALLSHDNMNSLAYQFINSPLEMQKGEKVLNLMPPFASYGLGNGTHVHLCAGMKLVLIPTYEPDKIEGQIKKYKPNRIACSPAHYEYIKNSEILKRMDLSFLKHPIEGGDSLNIKTEEAVNKLLLEAGCKDKVAKGYGLTESCSGVCVCINNETNKLQSVGVPLAKNIISIFDLDDKDKELEYGELGEIAILSPNNMLGYYGMPEETKSTLVTHSDGTVWLHTGDLGKIDEDGNIFISGRLRRMIIQFSGLKANPFEVETELIKHPLVKNVVVVGVHDPDHEQGELPVAFVLVDSENLNREEEIKEALKEMCEQNVTYYSIPIDYVIVDSYPRTPIGKIDFKAMSNYYNENAKSRNMIRQRQFKF